MLRIITTAFFLVWLIAHAWVDYHSPQPSDDWSIQGITTTVTAAPTDIVTIPGYADGQEYEVVWIEPGDTEADQG